VRAARSVHFDPGKPLGADNRLFIGSRRYSKLFPKAVDFQVTQSSGLIYRTIRTADGHRLNRLGKRSWFASTRACRAIWDLDQPEQRARAQIAATAIKGYTDYDLFDPGHEEPRSRVGSALPPRKSCSQQSCF
jgi:hypothetical protein